MQVSLTEQQEEWVQSLIMSGRYANTSDVLNHAIRLLQEEEVGGQAMISALQKAVKQGADEIERGEFSSKSVQDMIAEGRSRGL